MASAALLPLLVHLVSAADDIALIATPGALVRNGSDVCATFKVQTMGVRGPVEIFTNGLGDAQLSLDDPKTSCAQTRGAPMLTLPRADRPVSLRLKVPDQAFPADGAKVSGQIVAAVAGKGTTSVSVALNDRDQHPVVAGLFAGIKWFLTFGVPALATAAISFWVFKRQQAYSARKTQEQTFNDDLTLRYDTFRNQFTTWYESLAAEYTAVPKWCRDLDEKLQQNNCYSPMPERERAALRRALAARRPREAARILAQLYPEWHDQILHLPNGIPAER